ncbi:MotA/TolQ/ExbB proton channel family protein [bacterium]|nr:MotA/TolQ/ExbB proton channel family protein [bacterium]
MPMISVSTLLGIVLGFGLCIWAIMSATKDFHIFWHVESFAIVIGGTLATTLIAYRTRYVLRVVRSMARIFVMQPIQPTTLRDDVKQMVEWAALNQRGLGAVEDDFAKRQKPDPFLKHAIDLLMNGYKEHDLRLFLGDFIESSFSREMTQAQILNQMGGHAPAFGMVGTLIGLVIMLSNMGSDPSAIGPAMAMSLLATLYGVMGARMVFIPAASKIQQILEIEKYRRYMMLEGIVMLHEKRPASYVQDRLNSLLDPAMMYQREGAAKGDKQLAGKR